MAPRSQGCQQSRYQAAVASCCQQSGSTFLHLNLQTKRNPRRRQPIPPANHTCASPHSAMHISRLRACIGACHTSPALLLGGQHLECWSWIPIKFNQTKHPRPAATSCWTSTLSSPAGWAGLCNASPPCQEISKPETQRAPHYHQFSRHKLLFTITRNP